MITPSILRPLYLLRSVLSGALALTSSVGLGAEVADSAQDVRPLLIGAAVPNVTLEAADGSDFSLKAAVAR